MAINTDQDLTRGDQEAAIPSTSCPAGRPRTGPLLLKLGLLRGLLSLALTSGSGHAAEAAPVRASPCIVNIINFIRQCEPRIERITETVLYDTVVKQVEIMKAHQLRGTFLLQYDSLVDARYQKLLKEQPEGMFEIGGWWEIPQALVEKSGLHWRGKTSWDWHADVGFSTGYTPQEREKLVDTYMAEFKKIFGYYPQSVGSWFIDEHTLQYMQEHYGIVASCNCKDQIGTDGYTLWGGYWNQGYYPSKKNAYMPAQNAANQIAVPIFRMLGSDPIHQYDSGLGGDRQRVVTLEPVYQGGGGDAAWCQWYFDTFVEGAAMGYAYTQVGQENSFTWDRMAKGFEIQMPMIAHLQQAGKVVVKTLGETGIWFKDKYPVTPPTSVTVLKDYSAKNQKTVWFDSRFYRANLLWDQDSLRFRDIHLFDETIASDYLTKPGTSSECHYDTLPLVDGFRWSSMQIVAGLRFKTSEGAELKGGTPTVDDSKEGELVVHWPVNAPKGEILINFDETSVHISADGELKNNWCLELSSDKAAVLPFREITSGKITCEHLNTAYEILAKKGHFSKGTAFDYRINPEDQQILLDLSQRTSAGAEKNKTPGK